MAKETAAPAQVSQAGCLVQAWFWLEYTLCIQCPSGTYQLGHPERSRFSSVGKDLPLLRHSAGATFKPAFGLSGPVAISFSAASLPPLQKTQGRSIQPEIYCARRIDIGIRERSTVPLVFVRILEASFALYLGLIFAETWKKRSGGNAFKGILILVTALLFLRWITGFPDIRESFSGISYTLAIVVMYVCVILGMGANYAYDFKEGWSWQSFLRPVLISPMVLLPLLGTLGESTEFGMKQTVSLAILAFQNGFFWRTVFRNAKLR